MKSICVFCGANTGFPEVYKTTAAHVGKVLAQKGMTLVYGGGKVGLMGALADGALENGGTVTGVIPGFLINKEVAHKGLTQLLETDTMHSRKMTMYERADGIVVLPGGFGTMDELFEVLTWAQLGLHQKPIGLLNVNGFFGLLNALLDNMVGEGFVKQANRELLLSDTGIEALLARMAAYRPPVTEKWISGSDT